MHFVVVRFILPFSALAFFNTRLIMAVRDSSSLPGRHCGTSRPAVRGLMSTTTLRLQRQSTSVSSRKERYTLTLVVVVIVFVACELPDLLLRAWLALHSCLPSIPFPRDTLMFVNGASNLCLTLNSSVNFLVYCFVGQRFRIVLVRMICPARFRRPHRPSVSSPLLGSEVCVSRVGAFRGSGGCGGRSYGVIDGRFGRGVGGVKCIAREQATGTTVLIQGQQHEIAMRHGRNICTE